MGDSIQGRAVVQDLVVGRPRTHRLPVFGGDTTKCAKLVEDPAARPQAVAQPDSLQSKQQLSNFHLEGPHSAPNLETRSWGKGVFSNNKFPRAFFILRSSTTIKRFFKRQYKSA